MNAALITLLALIWGVVLLPELLRGAGGKAESTFAGLGKAVDNSRDTVVGVTKMAAARLPQLPQASMVQRRRRMLVALGSLTTLMLPLGVMLGGPMMLAGIATTVALLAYVKQLRTLALERAERADKVARLADARDRRVARAEERRELEAAFEDARIGVAQ